MYSNVCKVNRILGIAYDVVQQEYILHGITVPLFPASSVCFILYFDVAEVS
jgi:hypothetical protein